ncbi:MAG: hypothetical protein LBP63_11500 [Prevotellaceae bacterium]|jgi:archaellum component FlaC|nr:hypothetical protein [Prevotellaceae bacterium]
MKGIIESLGINEITEQIKAVTAALEDAGKSFNTFGDNVKGILNDLVNTYKEVKKTVNFTELGEATRKAQKQIEELTEAEKAQAAQQKKYAE